MVVNSPARFAKSLCASRQVSPSSLARLPHPRRRPKELALVDPVAPGSRVEADATGSTSQTCCTPSASAVRMMAL